MPIEEMTEQYEVVGLDYEKEYNRMTVELHDLQRENERLKEAIINIAIKM